MTVPLPRFLSSLIAPILVVGVLPLWLIRNVLAEGGYTEADVQKLYIYFHAEGDWAAIEAWAGELLPQATAIG